jgi:hypothetical protein
MDRGSEKVHLRRFDTPYIVCERTTDSQVSALNKSPQLFFSAIADVQCILSLVDIDSIGGARAESFCR